MISQVINIPKALVLNNDKFEKTSIEAARQRLVASENDNRQFETVSFAEYKNRIEQWSGKTYSAAKAEGLLETYSKELMDQNKCLTISNDPVHGTWSTGAIRSWEK